VLQPHQFWLHRTCCSHTSCFVWTGIYIPASTPEALRGPIPLGTNCLAKSGLDPHSGQTSWKDRLLIIYLLLLIINWPIIIYRIRLYELFTKCFIKTLPDVCPGNIFCHLIEIRASIDRGSRWTRPGVKFTLFPFHAGEKRKKTLLYQLHQLIDGPLSCSLLAQWREDFLLFFCFYHSSGLQSLQRTHHTPRRTPCCYWRNVNFFDTRTSRAYTRMIMSPHADFAPESSKHWSANLYQMTEDVPRA